jgi:hypothetical protein
VLGIDPGATTGWCCYDTHTRRVVARGLYEGHDTVVLQPSGSVATVAVLERLVPHGASYPQVVESAYVAGRIAGELRPAIQVHEMTRAEVRRILQEATHGSVKVKDDKSVRAAVVLLHGGDSATEAGGCLHGVTSHVWAALAVAVAWTLRREVPAG